MTFHADPRCSTYYVIDEVSVWLCDPDKLSIYADQFWKLINLKDSTKVCIVLLHDPKRKAGFVK